MVTTFLPSFIWVCSVRVSAWQAAAGSAPLWQMLCLRGNCPSALDFQTTRAVQHKTLSFQALLFPCTERLHRHWAEVVLALNNCQENHCPSEEGMLDKGNRLGLGVSVSSEFWNLEQIPSPPVVWTSSIYQIILFQRIYEPVYPPDIRNKCHVCMNSFSRPSSPTCSRSLPRTGTRWHSTRNSCGCQESTTVTCWCTSGQPGEFSHHPAVPVTCWGENVPGCGCQWHQLRCSVWDKNAQIWASTASPHQLWLWS